MVGSAATLDCAIVGAGIHGLCAAFWAVRLGARRVAVFERGDADHTLGGSHGVTRIGRATYERADFVQLAQTALRRDWPVLENALGAALRTPTPGVFFGPRRGPIAAYATATRAAGAAVAPLAVATARRRFPLLAFAEDDLVLEDREAVVLGAAATMQGLRTWLTEAGVALHWREPVADIHQGAGAVDVVTALRTVRARSVVLAAGAWAPRLVTWPTATTALFQTVGYGELAAPAAAIAPGTFPVWCRIAPGPDGFCYGLPADGVRGVKFAVHRTSGPADDPDQPATTTDPAALAAAERCFAVPLRLTHVERCLYTMTADQRIAAAPLPDAPRCIAVTACSGHGFKFGPLVGRLAAELAHAASG